MNDSISCGTTAEHGEELLVAAAEEHRPALLGEGQLVLGRQREAAVLPRQVAGCVQAVQPLARVALVDSGPLRELVAVGGAVRRPAP